MGSVTGTVHVECPGCGRKREAKLVQSITADRDIEAKRQLLAGELNVLACECGRRTQLAANVLFHDAAKSVYIRVVPDAGDHELAEAAALFRAAGVVGTARLVPSLNALVEKVKILEAGLEDWAIEMTKVLLLSTIGDLDRVLLFDRIDDDAVHWVLFDAAGDTAEPAASARAAYERIAARAASRPRADECQIDRAWAVAAVTQMIESAS